MPLAPVAARRVYDRIGRIQDTQRLYEDPPVSRLAELSGFESAHAVFELGCGTGRYAARLLRERLPADARYVGVDISPTMVWLAAERLREWGPRARVELIEPPALALPGGDGEFDRFVATYVFDLLEIEYSERLLGEARRLLAPDGRLCLVALTEGATPAARRAASVWSAVAGRWPGVLGGCRPIRLEAIVGADWWRVEHHETLTRWWITSEVLVAGRLADRGDG